MAINYVVRVSDGENEIYYQRKKLYDMGLRFNKRAGRGDSFYEKKCEENEAHAIEKFAELNGLKCILIPEQYTRSDNTGKSSLRHRNRSIMHCTDALTVVRNSHSSRSKLTIFSLSTNFLTAEL